jgi:CYTH domain-containing protein
VARPPYAVPEIERRWLVEPATAQALATGPAVHISDRYIDATRLRLRRVSETNGEIVYKLCKKYGDAPGAESITNLYLSAAEFQQFDTLPGWVVEKQRYRTQDGCLDIYSTGSHGLAVFEREFADAMEAVSSPSPAFVEREITGSAAFTGSALARRFGKADRGGPALGGNPAGVDGGAAGGADTTGLNLLVLPDEFTVHRLAAAAALPEAPAGEPLYATLRSQEELSICCRSALHLSSDRAESGWRCLMVEGPLDFTLTGIVSGITAVLARNGIAVFVISSFDTDYVLIKRDRLTQAVDILALHGMHLRYC